MSDIHAKPIIDNKFWIVEQDGKRFATLRKNEDDRFVLMNEEFKYTTMLNAYSINSEESFL